jgi:hypothetical protein
MSRRGLPEVATSWPQNRGFLFSFRGCREDKGNRISATYGMYRKFDPHRPYQIPNVLIGFSGQQVPEVPKGTSWVGKYRFNLTHCQAANAIRRNEVNIRKALSSVASLPAVTQS